MISFLQSVGCTHSGRIDRRLHWEPAIRAAPLVVPVAVMDHPSLHPQAAPAHLFLGTAHGRVARGAPAHPGRSELFPGSRAGLGITERCSLGTPSHGVENSCNAGWNVAILPLHQWISPFVVVTTMQPLRSLDPGQPLAGAAHDHTSGALNASTTHVVARSWA